jgi:hypothetical protein
MTSTAANEVNGAMPYRLPLSYFAGGNGDFEEYFWDSHKQNNNW